MSERQASAQLWSSNEQALRDKYDDMGLMVRKQVYANPDEREMVVGGWAFLDGEPAIVPMDLDLLVVSVASPSGAIDTMGREPGAMIAVLGDRVSVEELPVRHWAIRVVEADKAGLLDQIRALPEHKPTPAAPTAPAPSAATPSAFAPTVPVSAAPSPGFVPTAQPTRSNGSGAAVGAGLGVAAIAVGGGCLLLMVLMGAGAGAYVFLQADEPDYVYEPYEPAYEPVPEPIVPAAPRPSAGSAAGTRFALPLPASAPSRGAPTSPLTIQIFSDFQCPFCSRVNPTMNQIEENYRGRVRIVWRHLPLPFHRNAMPAAEASVEVFQQGGDAAFWAYHDLLFENQRQLGVANLVALAGQVPGVNAQEVSSALADHRHQPRVQSDVDAVRAAGMRAGTPTFLIGEVNLSGAQPYARFAEVIDAELSGR